MLAIKRTVKLSRRRFNYYRPQISQKDVGEMSIEQIKQELGNQIEGIFHED